MFLNVGPYGDSCPFPQPSLYVGSVQFFIKFLVIKKSHPSLEGPAKEEPPPHVHQNSLHANSHPFQSVMGVYGSGHTP